MPLQGRKIVVGVTGSIAAYKTPQLVRLLVKEGADVQVIMTQQAKLFVTPLSLATVSKNPVMDSVQEGGQWNNHVLLGRSADLFLIAPCSANTLAKLAHGICDNMLLATYLSADCPVMIAPAMDEDMWMHPATKANIATLQDYGHQLIPVEPGELASGLVGKGRMAEPETIVQKVRQQWADFPPVRQNTTTGKRALVTAGPTYESIDPVRFIGNHSSGKMGVALALALTEKGYQVDLVTGPGVIPPHHAHIQIHPVVSAQEMYEQCHKLFPRTHITVMAAAVSDYRPEHTAEHKIKKTKEDNNTLHLTLIQNPDILASLGKIKSEQQILVGFALETEKGIQHARKKLKSKKADFIVLNSLSDEGAGFGTDTNKATILTAEGQEYPLPLQSKQKIAEAIIDRVLSFSDHYDA